MAKLVPVRARSGKAERAAAFDRLAAFAKTVKAKPFDLRKAIEQGRK